MTADHVEKYPVMTFASGPTNSMRGAAYLSGEKNALVADIGGTTTDIGMLLNGFPRESSVTTDIGGVRTNFRMPDVLSIGLGGGSIVMPSVPPKIGPRSVGFNLQQEAMVFGGKTLTVTDISVALGIADIGDKNRVAHLPVDQVRASYRKMHSMLETGIDRIKTNASKMPLILVGGGAQLIQGDLAGISDVIVPEHAGVANAIGASIAQVGAEVDKVFSYEETGREAAIGHATNQAMVAAIEAGAIEGTVETIDVEEIPLSYIPGGAVRLRVKVAGELAT